MTHTPGPWTLKGSQGEENVWSPAGDFLASIYSGDLEKGEANARLIAAAPDMLAALKEFATFETGDWTPEDMRAFARAAIAKAEGGK